MTAFPHFPVFYLASASPRRHALLTEIGIAHEVLRVPAPDGEDEPIHPGEAPVAYVQRTAMDKAHHAARWIDAQALPQRAILCADTTVALDDAVLGKPQDARHAAAMLARLSGRRHLVHTAVVLLHQGATYQALSTTEVGFNILEQQEIDGYCATGEPMGKAGAYGIQGRAGVFVTHLSGSYSGVVGLPLHETYALLRRAFG